MLFLNFPKDLDSRLRGNDGLAALATESFPNSRTLRARVMLFPNFPKDLDSRIRGNDGYGGFS